MNETSTTRMEAACSLLSEPERRYVLYQLTDRHGANIDEITDGIAAWKFDADPTTVDEARRQQIYISLVHNHLPRLADYDIIDYDLRSGDIVLTEGFEDIKPLLTQFKQTEEDPKIRELPSL
ncbi:hypothetical protein SAMN04487967_1746 [Natronorubrum sediminis]|uniref:DUF7344 domain-containing protein n=1 Tax=Natronorubrum sediminis TaxID=640943 RepID=A0A1H6FXJ8_9EURY|nr:hypothetical protein [Natronorubrum sediminis]SEH14743.1 hypothetical protein SAMN04487967_1746 [Natronorubrum sediminis]